jgi:hypothetical protein
MNLEEIKDQYAKSLNGMTWDQVTMDRSLFDASVDEVAKRYARECCKASLEKAADNAEATHEFMGGRYMPYDKLIDNPENITLL